MVYVTRNTISTGGTGALDCNVCM